MKNIVLFFLLSLSILTLAAKAEKLQNVVVESSFPSVNGNGGMRPLELYQTEWRGVNYSPRVFRNNDYKTLGVNWNVNFVRLQLSIGNVKGTFDGSDLKQYNDWINKELDLLDTALSVCKKYGLKAVVDLHSLPGGRDKSGNMVMFYNKKYNDYFVDIWQRIVKRYRGNSAVWGYDLVNEPLQNIPTSSYLDFRQTETRAAQKIRNLDSNVKIICEVDQWDAPDAYKHFTPIPISGVVYEVHVYNPVQYTHQGVGNRPIGFKYPGIINGTVYDRNKLKEILDPVREFQNKYNVPIYVGEFSAVRWAPGASDYLNDCISIFEEYGWNWTYHAYKDWDGWDLEYENGSSPKGKSGISLFPTDRKKVLLNYFTKNQK